MCGSRLVPFFCLLEWYRIFHLGVNLVMIVGQLTDSTVWCRIVENMDFKGFRSLYPT